MIAFEKIKEMFMALKLHFTSKYDFVKYQGRTRAQQIQPRERYAIERIARKYDNEENLKNFFIANMAHSFLTKGKVDTYIGNYSTKEAAELFEQSENWWNATSYNLAKDIRTLENLSSIGSFTSALRVKDGEHPEIFTQYIDGNISFNTIVCILLWRDGLLKYWKNTCEDTILFGSYLQFLEKYIPLISRDKQKVSDILQKSLTNTM